jgi:phthalate 4,5-dioxygenase oxygenase subunit
LRCIYHGWKFDVDGRILEMPNCASPAVKERIHQGSYPVREAGGLGWVYLGPPATEPPFPRYPWMQLSPAELTVSELYYDCNWLQVQEGSLDSSHLGALHLDTLAATSPGPRRLGSFVFPGEVWDPSARLPFVGEGNPSDDNAPRIVVENTPFGFHYAAIRQTPDPRKVYVRITALSFPYVAHIGGTRGAVIVVPREQESCSFIGVFAGRRPGSEETEMTGSWQDRPWDPYPTRSRALALPVQDRTAMARRQSFAGIRGGNRYQDAVVQGIGRQKRTYSRATEHLIPADAAVARLRHLLIDSARRLEAGDKPHGLGVGYDYSKLQAASAVIDVDRPWQELVPGNTVLEVPSAIGTTASSTH